MAALGEGGRGRAGLLVALATLSLPLAGIVFGTLQRPAPAPAAIAEQPAAVVEAIVLQAEPPREVLPPPVVAAPPPPPQPPPAPVNPFPLWTREDSLNILLVGVDRRDDKEVPRTDSLILANVDLGARHATLVSIPRDLVVQIPGYGQDRVNGVYALGETSKRPGGGLGLLRDTLERNFGVSIHHHAAIDFNCFRGTVDALGGVTLTVPAPIYDPHYPTDDYGYKVVTFEPGLQWLDGGRALEYARSRYGDTDFGRMRRQQQLLTAVKEQALHVQNLAALPKVVRACGGMASDLNALELVALGSAVREIRQSDISFRVIDEQMAVPYVAPSGASVLIPRWDAIRAMVRSVFPSTSASASAANQTGGP